MVWSDESRRYQARCRTTHIPSGEVTTLQIEASSNTGEALPQVGVKALLVPRPDTSGPVEPVRPEIGEAFPDGTLYDVYVKVEAVRSESDVIYAIAFSVPKGAHGGYQLVLDWRRGPQEGEHVAVDNDDPYGIYHIAPRAAV